MNFVTNLWQQVAALWQRSSLTYRAALVATSVVALMTIVGVGWWSSRPQYILLADQLSPSEAAEIVTKLQAANIPYELGFSGSSISVPTGQWNEAKIATKDVADSENASDALAGSIISDPTTKQLRLLKEKERTLAATILRMPAIASADVHLAVPDPTPFERDRQPPTASVLLGIRRGRVLGLEQAATISALVAASVEGLSVENVTISDLDGRNYSTRTSGSDQILSQQLEYRRRIEADLSARAEQMLAPIMGDGRAIVRVSADIDFTQTERTEKTVDKANSAKIREQLVTKSVKGGGAGAAGPAGAKANLAGGAQTGNATVSTQDDQTSDTTYEPARTVDVTKIFGGKVTRLTVAVVVDPPAADPNATPPVPAFDLAKAQNLIKQAVGFDSTRDDQIEVMQAPLQSVGTAMPTLLETLDRWEFYTNLAKNASLGLASVVALVLGFMWIRKMQPLTITAPPEEQAMGTRDSRISDLAAQMQNNPEVVARVLAAWLNTPSNDGARNPAAGTPAGARPSRMAA